MIRSPAEQEIDYDHRSTEAFQRQVVEEAVSRLRDARGPVEAQHWKSSRNADMFLLSSGTEQWILKILVSKPAVTVQTEYAHLEDLWCLGGEGTRFSVPRPIFYLPGRSAYVMERVNGERLDRYLLRAGKDPAGARETAGRCGEMLARIHSHWAEGLSEQQGRNVLAGLTDLPWRTSAGDRKLLEEVVAKLNGRPLRTSRLYFDFDPVNVLRREDGGVVLLDPPEVRTVGFSDWDLGTFALGIRRAWWRSPLAGPRFFPSREPLVEAFAEGYEATAPSPDRAGSDLLRGFSELGRLGQLWKWWLHPFTFRRRLEGVGRAVYAYPLLARERTARMAALRELVELC